MGDAKVKQQPFFATPSYQQPTTSKAAMGSGPTAVTGSPNATKTTPPGKDDGGGTAASKSPTKYEQLKLRKAELEKRLNEKYAQLQQIKRDEAQLIGMYPSDFSAGVGSQDQNGTAPTLRRKVGTSFKLPENLLNNKEDDINKLLLEKQIQQQISEASLRLSNDTSQPKSVRRTHKQNYESAQQKLLAMNQNLSLLKKRQQQQAAEQQKSPPPAPASTRDDIDLHKNSNANRFRSNSNSSSMMMMNMSERRNSIKSNTSSTHSSNLNSSAGPIQKHHQQLVVQIPGQQHPTHYHSQQISPYSIHSGTLSVMPSGSQSMTPAASAAMVSQLSMLRHRARCDSFNGIMTYDLSGAATAVDAAKMSPVSSGSGHLHHTHSHPHFQQPQSQPQPANRLNKLIHQQQMLSYSPPPGSHHLHSPGYVMSPPESASSTTTVGQAFVYDTKMISRFQAPPPPPPPQAVLQQQTDQNFNPSNSYEGQQQEVAPTATTPTTTGGLGGYWMMLETGEKVWCAVDTRFSSLDRKQGGGSMKISRSKLSQHSHAAPTKSNSMGNFDFINKQHQLPQEDSIQPDAISITSASSEHKKREKVWRETSLDSPVVRHKTPLPSPPAAATTLSHPLPLPAYPQPPPPPPPHQVQVQSQLQTPLHVNTSSGYGMSPSSPLLLSPQQMRYYQQKQQQILEQQRQQAYRIKQLEEQKHQAYLIEQHQQQKLLQQKQLRSPPQLPKHQQPYNGHNDPPPPPIHHHQQQHLDLLPHSPQLYDHENHNHLTGPSGQFYQTAAHQDRQSGVQHIHLSSRHPDLLISPTLSASSSNTLTSPTLQRPQSSVSPTPSTGAAAIIHATPDIQTESPKNVTVVQQGKIMPYKEVTKPFEMSDFYKYSTKYRQKQQQQQQPPQHPHHHHHHHQLAPVGQMSPNGNSVVPSMCYPINYN